MTVWISHRGLSEEHDENTRSSFQRACEAGFSWLETDLHATGDEHIILCHDPELNHAACSMGKIEEMTRSQLEQVQLRKGEKLLFLDEFISEFNDQNWVFDIKPSTALQTINILKPLLTNNKKLLNKIVFLFWDKEQQSLFLNDFPEAICFPRESECYRAGIAILFGMAFLGNISKNKIYSIPPKLYGLPLLNKRITQAFHKQGAQVIGYLPETRVEIQQCLDAGVDYILCNHPPFLNRS